MIGRKRHIFPIDTLLFIVSFCIVGLFYGQSSKNQTPFTYTCKNEQSTSHVFYSYDDESFVSKAIVRKGFTLVNKSEWQLSENDVFFVIDKSKQHLLSMFSEEYIVNRLLNHYHWQIFPCI